MSIINGIALFFVVSAITLMFTLIISFMKEWEGLYNKSLEILMCNLLVLMSLSIIGLFLC